MKKYELHINGILISVTLLIASLMTYILVVDRQMEKEQTPLIESSWEIQKQSLLGHLWFEEIISGDTSMNFKEVISHIDTALWYTNSILVGGYNENITIVPIQDSELRKGVILVKQKLERFKEITIERWENKEGSGIGSKIDQEYDIIFDEFIIQVSNIESQINKQINKTKHRFHNIQVFLIIGSLLLFLAIIIKIRSYIIAQRESKGDLKEQIEKYAALNEELAASEEEYRTINEELITTGEILEQNDQRYKLAIAATNLGIWDWNIITDEIYYSKLWKSQIGYEDNELENKLSTWQEHLHPDESEEKNKTISDYLENPVGKYISEFQFRHKNGTYIWVHARAEVLRNDKGEIIRLFGSHRDITKRKLAEQKLKKQNEEYIVLNEELAASEEEIRSANEDLLVAKEMAEESDKLKTEFINNMSHEIRTPMNGILGFSGFLDNENLSTEKRNQYIKVIQNSGKQLLRIIDDILEISELETKQVKVYDEQICLNDLLLEQFSIFDIKAKENRIPLYIKKGLSDEKSIILTDESKLNKIISNLLENALKYTDEGFVELGYELDGDHKIPLLEIYVKDTGIGIKAENHITIFDRFSQEEKELSKNVGGLGLGLSIAKENAELLGGKISLESKKGVGSTFTITIPYKSIIANELEKNIDANLEDSQDRITILIAEDEEVNYLYLDILLRELETNINIIHSKHGKEVVELCKNNLDIDLVLMDLKMPIMNGFEAAKIIKEFRPKLPIIAQTAYSTSEEREAAILAGCDDFISKPISEETLKQIINNYLNVKL